jgi:hypothetical protein
MCPFFYAPNFMKNHTISAKDVKERVSIVDLLSRLGYEPAKRARNEHLYLSMLRDSDSTPSFSVNDRSGTWYDFGEGKGGNIIDFGLLYWKGCSFHEVLDKIVAVADGAHNLASSGYVRKPVEPRQPNYEVLDVKDLGGNIAISNYLESRGVTAVAGGRLKEIYYYVEDEQKQRSNFFAAGWQNEQGAWEVRSLTFKGCLGRKAISFIPDSGKSLSVFEGFFNYLSWLTANPFSADSVLVLNSISLLQAAICKAEGFRDISLYLDNDISGRQATLAFQSALPWAKDCAGIYRGYNDFNDMLMAERKDNELVR